jgi:hypothetical protein
LWLVLAETSTLGDWEEFSLVCLEEGKAALQTRRELAGARRYVTALGSDYNWLLEAKTTILNDFEQFTLFDAVSKTQRSCLEVVDPLEENGEASVAFLTFHNRFVSAMNGSYEPAPWALRADAGEIQARETFVVRRSP